MEGIARNATRDNGYTYRANGRCLLCKVFLFCNDVLTTNCLRACEQVAVEEWVSLHNHRPSRRKVVKLRLLQLERIKNFSEAMGCGWKSTCASRLLFLYYSSFIFYWFYVRTFGGAFLDLG